MTSLIPMNRSARRSLSRRGGALGAGGVLVAGSAAALLTALVAQAGASTTITVDSSGDGAADATHCTDGTTGNCTIRDAAAAAVDGDTISFDPSISAITLTNGTIATRAVNIVGPGASSLTITTSAGPGAYDMFVVSGTGDATISGLTITNNRINAANAGRFTLDGVAVSGSQGANGGALYSHNSGDLVITNSGFENNSSGAGGDGGAIYAHSGGAVTITDSAIVDNVVLGSGRGGGIHVATVVSSFSLTGSVITGNSATWGGGLDISTYGTIAIADSTISSNTTVMGGAGALVAYPGDIVSIEGTTIDGNVSGFDGGGVRVSGRSLVVTDSTISNNQAVNAGGGIAISRGQNLTINNTTITGNEGIGGGLYTSHIEVVINQSTITDNVGLGNGGGGVWLYENDMHLSGTIISGNSSSDADCDDVSSFVAAAIYSDHSILGSASDCITYSTLPVTDLGGTIRSTTPGLAALADNGGPTRTMARGPTSVAIDAGPNPVASFTGNGFDQRGTPFARVSNGRVDIGAFEVQVSPPPTTTTIAPTTTTTSTDVVVPTFTG